MKPTQLQNFLNKIYLQDIPQKIYSIKFNKVIGSLSFFGVILVPLLTIVTNNISIIGTGFLTIDFIVGLFLIWLLGNHFMYKSENKFISLEDYFCTYENNLHLNIDSPNFINYLKRTEDFLNSNSKLLMIYSLTGYGRSHLLREISKKAKEIDNNRKIRFIAPNSYHLNIESCLEKELDKTIKYLIIWDSINIKSEEANKILSYCKNKDIKVIFTLKNCELNQALDKFNEFEHEKLKIQWQEDDLVYFLRQITGKSSISDKKIIISYSNPSLILTKIEALNTSSYDFKKIDSLVEQIEQDICLNLSNHTAEENKNLLINITCIVPFPKDNNEILGILENQSDFEVNEIKKIIDNLIKSDVLKLVNDSVRFSSDILGYLYLFYKIKDSADEEFDLLINGLVFSKELWHLFPNNIYKNLGNASQIMNIFLENVTTINIPLLERYFSSIISGWVDNEAKTYGTKRNENLKYLEYFCKINPDSCLDLLNSYLDNKEPKSPDRYLNHTSTTDNFGPIILQLVDIPNIKKEVIDIIEKMESKGMTGSYGNYWPNELIKYLVSPFKNSDKPILQTLNILEEFLDDLNTQRIKMLSSALNEIFSVSEYITNWGLFEVQSFPVQLHETPKLLIIRNKALEILKKMINNPSLEVKLEGLKIAKEIGERDPKNEISLKNQLIKERNVILSEIGNLIDNANFKVLCQIEDLFLEWWALETPGTEETEKYLSNKNFPRSIEYITTKSLTPSEYVIYDFDSFRDKAPSQGRWKWFVNNRGKYFKNIYKPKTYKKLSNLLNKKYSDENKLVILLKEWLCRNPYFFYFKLMFFVDFFCKKKFLSFKFRFSWFHLKLQLHIFKTGC